MKYPFSFIDGTCPHCGAEKNIVFVDKYGKLTNDPIYTANGMICKKCRSEFRIHWENINGKMVPLCCSDEYKDDLVSSMIRYAMENRRKL